MRPHIPGYFVAPGADGDLWIWRETDGDPAPILAQRSLRDDLDRHLWNRLVALVQRGAS